MFELALLAATAVLALPVTAFLLAREHRRGLEATLRHLEATQTVGGEPAAFLTRRMDAAREEEQAKRAAQRDMLVLARRNSTAAIGD